MGDFPHLETREEVQSYLRQAADAVGAQLDSDAVAKELDRRDPVAHLRSCFHVPTIEELLDEKERAAGVDPSSECVYMCGNSLGLQPKTARAEVTESLDSWARRNNFMILSSPDPLCVRGGVAGETTRRGVRGHFVGPNPWMPIEDTLIPGMAKLVGAKEIEVTVMNTLTVNLHLGLVPFYKPTPERYKILMEEAPFPSDLYAVQSQIRWHGYDPESAIVFAKPVKPGGIWNDEDIIKLIEDIGDTIALVMLSGVHYSTGYFFDMKSITEAGHKKGCCVGWDLAHAAGNVQLLLHDWDVDFACWCTYKYINAGPGCISGFFLHEKHAMKPELTRLLGWWSHKRETRLQMDNVLELQAGAKGFQISNPPALECCTLRASLGVFEQTSMEQLVGKSRLLTGYLEILLEECLESKTEGATTSLPTIDIASSKDPLRRGNQLSVHFLSTSLHSVHGRLSALGGVVDVRGPLMRVAPAPLFNSFNDVLKFVNLLRQTLSSS